MLQPTGFVDAWSRARTVPGWLTQDQAHELWSLADGLPAGGRVVEIGSHQGRSTVVIATAAKARGAAVTAIDPFIEGVLFGGRSTRIKFEQNVEQAGLSDVVDLIAEKSQTVRTTWTDPLDMLYIDGKHDFWTVRDDLQWATFLRDGAPILIHDAFSSVGVTLALYLLVLPQRRLRYVRRAGSLAIFVAERPRKNDRLRLVAQAPWWARNVLIKVMLRVTRLFGHQRPDPY